MRYLKYMEHLVSSHVPQRAGQHFLSVSELLLSSVKTVVSAKHTFSGVQKKKKKMYPKHQLRHTAALALLGSDPGLRFASHMHAL